MTLQDLIPFNQSYHIHIYIWLGIIIFSLILECLAKKVACLWFSLSAILALLIALLHMYFTIQFIAFAVASLILILINELYFKKKE